MCISMGTFSVVVQICVLPLRQNTRSCQFAGTDSLLEVDRLTCVAAANVRTWVFSTTLYRGLRGKDST